jgi:hypothetical protein
VANLDNPAGRLHALLSAYNDAVVADRTRREAWALVLGVDASVVLMQLWEVEALLYSTYAAVARSDKSDAFRASFRHHVEHWGEPFKTDLDYPSAHLDKSALVALDTISSFLSESASEGVLPETGEIQSLKDELLAVIQETKETEDAPIEVRQLIVERLYQIVWALDHVHIGGPDAVKAAVERLAGSLVITGPETATSAPARRSGKIIKKVWFAFLSGPVVEAALEAWPDVAERIFELGP